MCLLLLVWMFSLQSSVDRCSSGGVHISLHQSVDLIRPQVSEPDGVLHVTPVLLLLLLLCLWPGWMKRSWINAGEIVEEEPEAVELWPEGGDLGGRWQDYRGLWGSNWISDSDWEEVLHASLEGNGFSLLIFTFLTLTAIGTTFV